MSTAPIAQGPVDVNVRRQWLYDLIADNKKLPTGTRIKTTVGGIHNGECHELPDHVLESANRLPNHMSNYVPFWIFGWRDIHDDLLPPNAKVSGAGTASAGLPGSTPDTNGETT